jgi:hypothetical protein
MFHLWALAIYMNLLPKYPNNHHKNIFFFLFLNRMDMGTYFLMIKSVSFWTKY